MIWRSGIDAKCNYFNETWLAFTGRALAQEMGDGWAEGVHPQDLGPCLRGYLEHFSRREPFELEYRLRRFDGVYRYILDRGVPYRDRSGEFAGYIGSCVDVDELSRLTKAEQALREANARLTENDRRKNDFLAVLSHELRNPLSPIRAGVYLLDRLPADSAEAERAREIIKRQLGHLARIVDDLLDATRISRGKIQLDRRRMDLREAALRACEDHRAAFEQGQVQLRHDVPRGPVWIEADATRLSQVLGNLLLNAAKFTPARGEVTVEVVTSGGRAEVRVRDTGVGIRAEDLAHIFEPFNQARELARAQGGLGLGLTLSKGLVELHGGSLWARSDGPGRGSEFGVVLPVAPAPAEESIARRPTPRSAARRVVLIIEDNVDACESLSVALGLKGHEVRTAHDGETGIAAAHEIEPDVVLCDIGLPDIDGYEVARRLRADEALRATRLIALSGYARPEDKALAKEAGFHAHIAKPPELDELTEALAFDRIPCGA